MGYILTTLDQQRQRALTTDEFRAVLRLALTNGWQPGPQRIVQGKLRLTGDLSAEEARQIAAALERGLQKNPRMEPPLMVALLETIGVLRFGASRFVPRPD